MVFRKAGGRGQSDNEAISNTLLSRNNNSLDKAELVLLRVIQGNDSLKSCT